MVAIATSLPVHLDPAPSLANLVEKALGKVGGYFKLFPSLGRMLVARVLGDQRQ
jgi:hypothetical protein